MSNAESSVVESERIAVLRDDDPDAEGRYVLYWMQASQRAEHNPALEFAVETANRHEVPVVVASVVMPDYPEISRRSMAFFLRGLHHTMTALDERGVRTCVRLGDPVETVVELAADAVETVIDRGYLRHQRAWVDDLTGRLDGRLTRVEGDVVVPIDLVSDKAEYAARTIRPKIAEHRDRFIVELAPTDVEITRTPQGTTSDLDLARVDRDLDGLLDELGVTSGPDPVDTFTAGTDGADAALQELLDRVEDYDDDRNRFNDEASSSRLSPHLHYGHISPVAIAAEVLDRAGDDAEAFLEELIVRRELAVNFVARTEDYDRYSALPEWARESLDKHADDERPAIFTSSELEAGETDDEVWNAIMATIRRDGWVHNQLRMYWGKQIVQWTNTPDYAHRVLLELNNRYFLDGRDPSSYANVGWCFGLHDQGFAERDVSGKLRPFTTAALKRKDDLGAWVDAHAED